MGMSASQVRFLSLQNRKNTIGGELATLANRKSSLARDLKVISANYNNQMNQTELKWSNDAGFNYYDLSYDLLMRPNLINAKTPYIITDSSNRVVLNNDKVLDIDGHEILVDDTCVDSSGVEHVAKKPLTYITLARMISEWNNTPAPNGFGYGGVAVVEHSSSAALLSGRGDRTENVPLRSGGEHPYTYDENLTISGGDANPDAYVIPSDHCNFQAINSLRMQMFNLLGLVSNEQLEEYNDLLVGLYGNEAAYDSGVYPADCAMGQYKIALANREAYYKMLNVGFNYEINNATTSNFDLNFEQQLYSFHNYNISGNTFIKQSATDQTGGPIRDVYFTNYDTTYSNTISKNIDNQIVYTQTITNTGIEYTYSIGDIWNTATTNKGSSLTPSVLQLKKDGSDVATITDALAINGTTYNNVSSVQVRNYSQCDEYLTASLSDIVSDAISTLFSDLKEYSYLNLSPTILSRIKAELMQEVNNINNYNVTSVSSYNNTTLQNSANLAKNETAGSLPKIYAVISDDTVTGNNKFAFGYYNVNNLKEYVIKKYSEYSGATNTKTWNSKLKTDDTLLEYFDEEVEKAENRVNRFKSDLENLFTAMQMRQMDYYDALFLKIAQAGWVQDKDTSSETNTHANEYLEQRFTNNIFFVTECKTNPKEGGYYYTSRMAKNLSKIYTMQKADEDGIALQKYEAAKTEINMKEQKIDIIMNKLESEQEAITMEMDGLEKQITDNVTTVFKMFA